MSDKIDPDQNNSWQIVNRTPVSVELQRKQTLRLSLGNWYDIRPGCCWKHGDAAVIVGLHKNSAFAVCDVYRKGVYLGEHTVPFTAFEEGPW